MNTRGEVVLCLIGETCLIWIFVVTVVVCGEIVSSPHSYNYGNLICIKFIIRELSSSLVIP
jgi:hypothetical protein